MIRRRGPDVVGRTRRALVGALAAGILTTVFLAAAESPTSPGTSGTHGHGSPDVPTGASAAPARNAQHHGAPPGWKFALPAGDARKGRAVFVKLECYACHEVKGETFPGATDRAPLGPELSQMAAHHEPEFVAESIVNPNAVIADADGRAPDGTSRMPSYNDLMSVQELIDLVAFLKSLAPAADTAPHRH
jgi:cytochrome c1